MVHIKIGEYITFIPTNLKVKVASDDSIEYDGRIYKLSPLSVRFFRKKREHLQMPIRGASISRTTEKY